MTGTISGASSSRASAAWSVGASWDARQAAAEVEQYQAAVAASRAVRELPAGALADGSGPAGPRAGDSLPHGGH